MTFGEQLNAYLLRLGCTAKELSDSSGLSPSVISRYRSGQREADAENLQCIVDGIVRLAEEKGDPALTRESVAQTLEAALSSFPFETLQKNINALISTLEINVSDLAHYLNYDTSYISRIRNGQRRPAEPQAFATDLARYVVRKYAEPHECAALAHLMGCGAGELSDSAARLELLVNWLTSGDNAAKDLLLPFLTKVDSFDLNEFIRSIHFDELKVPTVPFQLPTSKSYYGLAEFRQAELDFFKAAVLSKSREPLILMDDTPMMDKTEGTDFKKKFIFAVALSLKKGLHLHFIHNINRPFEEMMMGLEGWIPMYMTGQISPYYLKGIHNNVFGHFLFSAGTAALSGECIMGYHDNGRFYLTNNKTEVAYYRTRAENLLSKATPLMEIYRSDTKKEFHAFLQKDAETPGPRRSILSALPLYTLCAELLEQILARNGLPEAEREPIRAYAARQRARMEEILLRDTVTDEIPLVTEQEFAEYPLVLPLSGLFGESDIRCTYGDYLAHRAQTEDFAAQHPNYTVQYSSTHAFRNIQIVIHEGKWAVISKNKAPAIHFVIRHPKLRSAIENFVAPV